VHGARALAAQRGLDALPEGRALLERAAWFSDRWSRPPSATVAPSLFAERVCAALVTNTRGEPVLVSRYRHAVAPPPDPELDRALMFKAAGLSDLLYGGRPGVIDTTATVVQPRAEREQSPTRG
jgi:hypothetical protein